MNLIEDITAHARDAYPEEACGLVVGRGHHSRIIRAKNIAAKPREHFDLDPEAWMEVGPDEAVLGVYHSHPDGTATPSLADKASCEASKLPWHILGYPGGDYIRIEPEGFRAPYLQRPYVHGVHDCFSLVRDWYRWELGIDIPDFERKPEWWLNGGDLYMDHFAACGASVVEGPIEVGDVFLIKVGSPVINHAAINLGGERILHHVYGRLSTIDTWAGYWAKHHCHTLRHKSRKGSTGNG